MGQYYRICMQNRDGLVVNDRRYAGSGYVMAKLMEHSYLGNHLMSSVAFAIENKPSRIMWVGDYAETSEIRQLTNRHVSYSRIWGDDASVDHEFQFKGKFDYAGKFLVNHTKKLVMSYDEYLRKNGGKAWGGDTFDPIPLLTAVGNGRGGGDYYGKNEDKIGSWAWDRLEIASDKPNSYKRFIVSFEEKP